MSSLLPTEKSIPISDLRRYILMIYGRPKVGKTTIASKFEDPLFLMFEPGAKSLSLFKKEITKWSTFTKLSKELRTTKAGKDFKTVVFDTFTIAYELCSKHVCKKHGWEHPSDAPYGKGWEAVSSEFRTEMNKLSLVKGVVLLAHAHVKDIEQHDGSVQEMIAPDVSKEAMRFINRSVDLCAYYYYAKNGRRYIRIQGSDDIMAGHRIDGHFLGASKFSAGNSAKEAYENLMKAFRNELSDEAPVAEGKKLSFKLK